MTENLKEYQESDINLLFRFKKPDGSYVSAIDPNTGKTIDKIVLLTPDEAKRIEDMGYQTEPVK
jgi:hypothetical protein